MQDHPSTELMAAELALEALHPLPSSRAVVGAVAKVTFLEIIQDKILYNALVCAILLLGLGVLVSRLTFGRPDRTIQDFGLGAVTLSSAGIAIFVGASVLLREFDRRTVYLALCRPITRTQFMVGKFFGVGLVLVVNWVLLLIAFMIEMRIFAAGYGTLFLSAGIVGLLLSLLQSFVLASFALCVSAFSTTSLSVVISLGLYVMGHNVTQMRLLIAKMDAGWWKSGLYGLSYLTPNLENFDLGFAVTYGLPISAGEAAVRGAYGLSLIVFFLGLGGSLIQVRQA